MRMIWVALAVVFLIVLFYAHIGLIPFLLVLAVTAALAKKFIAR
jgi:hypothetical protein